MTLLAVILVLIVVGVLLWALNTYGGAVIDGKILQLINIVVIIAVVIWLLGLTGILGSVDVPFPRVR